MKDDSIIQSSEESFSDENINFCRFANLKKEENSKIFLNLDSVLK